MFSEDAFEHGIEKKDRELKIFTWKLKLLEIFPLKIFEIDFMQNLR